MPSGNFYVRVKNTHTVSNCRASVLVPPIGIVDLGTMLEGDANDDDRVSILDFSVLRSGYYQCVGDTGYDDRANFNDDSCVNILDFSLLRTNYYKQGPIMAASASGTVSATPEGTVNLEIAPPVRTASVGQIFTVALNVLAGGQQVDGADAVVGFDPQYLRVVNAGGQEVNQIEAGSALSTALRNVVNNQNGRIEYSAGQLEGDPPTGTFELAVVRFKLIAEPPTATEIAYLAGTDVSHQGASVIGQLEDGQVLTPEHVTYLPLLIK
jgi:hypothetical protein